jgi:hypothetical protein
MRTLKRELLLVAAVGTTLCACTQVEPREWIQLGQARQPVLTVTDRGNPAEACAGSCGSVIAAGAAVMTPGILQSRELRISYTATGGRLTLRLARYSARSAGSSPLCKAPDPGDRVNIRIHQDGRLVFDATLSRLAADPGVELRTAKSSLVRLTYGLDGSAGNAYMGCRSTADLVWVVS